MTQIELGNNIYDVDFDDIESMKDALKKEIKFQYARHNINIRNSHGIEYDTNVYIYKRFLGKSQVYSFEYQPDYRKIKHGRVIRCYSKESLKSMQTLINKFITRCEETIKLKDQINVSNQEFMRSVNESFPQADIEFADNSKWVGTKTSARIKFDCGHISIYTDWHVYVEINNQEHKKETIVNTLNKLIA